MNKITVRFLCLLLVCALVFQVSPIKAQAVFLDTFLVAAPVVVAGIFIALGVFALTGSATWQNAVSSCVSFLEETTDFIVDDMIECYEAVNNHNALMRTVGLALVETVKQWLVDNGFITQHSVLSYGSGVEYVHSTELSSQARAYWNEIDIYNIAASAALGEILLLAGNYPSNTQTVYGLQLLESSGYRLLSVQSVYSNVLAPYTSSNFPVGKFVSLTDASSSNEVPTFGSSSSYSTRAIFLTYDDAVAAYNDPALDCSYYFYLTPDSYIDPYTSSASSTGWNDVSISSIVNLGSISSSGLVSVGKVNIIKGSGYNDYRYILSPAGIVESVTYTTRTGVVGGYIADPSLDVLSGYPTWAQNSIVQDDSIYLPVGTVPSLDDFSALNQEQIWTGSVYAAMPVISQSEAWVPEFFYEVGETPSPLFAKAVSTDGGKLSYQWYCNSFPIAGETTAVFYPPTTAVGSYVYSCLVTNTTINDVTASHAWTWSQTVTVSAVGSDVTPTTPPGICVGNHSFKQTVTKAPTCSTTGIAVNTCMVCGTTYTEVVSALAHTWVSTDVAVDCVTYECSVCSTVKTEIPVSGVSGDMSSISAEFQYYIDDYSVDVGRFPPFLNAVLFQVPGEVTMLVWFSTVASFAVAVFRKWFK